MKNNGYKFEEEMMSIFEEKTPFPKLKTFLKNKGFNKVNKKILISENIKKQSCTDIEISNKNTQVEVSLKNNTKVQKHPQHNSFCKNILRIENNFPPLVFFENRITTKLKQDFSENFNINEVYKNKKYLTFLKTEYRDFMFQFLKDYLQFDKYQKNLLDYIFGHEDYYKIIKYKRKKNTKFEIYYFKQEILKTTKLISIEKHLDEYILIQFNNGLEIKIRCYKKNKPKYGTLKGAMKMEVHIKELPKEIQKEIL